MTSASNESSLHNLSLTAHYIPRPRLDALLDQASRGKIVYVVAGTGYGKTQAVRHYVEQQRDAVVRWIQLTERDNVGSRYWERMTHVIAMDNPGLAVKLREFGFPETLVRFKQFAEIIESAEHRSRKIIFVLDDVHLVCSQEMLTFVERCAQLQSPGVYTIYISRQEPEVNIASLLSKGKISMITEDELRFTEAETVEFFRQCKMPLSAQDVSRVIDATKGWALAISMFSLILKRTPNHFEHALDAMRQNIFKLLENETWEDIPEHVQKTMVKLSLLADLSVMPLQEFLGDVEYLKDTPELTSFIGFNSFTNDFKIHPLYLEFLQSKYDLLSEEERQETYRWAAQWCFEHGFHMDAMGYYAKSHQFERMIQTLLSYPFKLPQGISEYFLNILENLNPGDAEQSNPSVLLLKNYFIPLLLIGMGKYEEARARASSVIREWEYVDTPLAMIFLHVMYSVLAYIEMHTCTCTHQYDAPVYIKKSIEYYTHATLPPVEEMSVSFINADIRSFACLVGEGAGVAEFDQFLDAAKQAELLIAETPYNIFAGYGDLVSCECAFFKNQLDLARSYAHSVIVKAQEHKQYSIAALAKKYLLHIAMQEGNVGLTKELLKQLRAHLDNPDFWNRQLYYDLYIGMFYAKIGRLEQVPQWFVMDDKELASEICLPTRELYVSALYYVAAKQYHQVLAVLCNSYPREPQERFLLGELRLSLLTAVARIQTGDTAGAMAEFEKAYALSFQGVFEMCFIELGKELHPLVVAALKQANSGIPEGWLRAMDRKASIYTKKIAIIANAFKSEANSKKSVSLSEREREVLIDLYHGLSREEIAENRHLSINTVKKMLQSIYIKLDANNNVDAIRIALEKKLVD